MRKSRQGNDQLDSNNGNQQQLRRSPRLNPPVDSAANNSSDVEMAETPKDVKPKEPRPDNKTCLAYEERCTLHKLLPGGGDHPERPERIQRIFNQLKEEGLVNRCIRVKSRTATMEEILLVHEENYVKDFSSTPRMDVAELRQWQQKWNSIYVCPDTLEAALLACGNLLECVDAVVDGRALNGAAVIRPPGHHAESDAAYGFCFFNNVAIAARYAKKMLGVGKILILDWDVHHGNGVQSAFYTDPSVLYISLHRYDHGRFFPCENGNAYNYTDIGEGAGRGFNINIPWDGRGIGDGEYLEAFKKIVMPVALEFKPELVLVSAGFDAARGDPLGGYRVTPRGFAQMTSMLCTLAGGRVILALEGGYNLTSISESMAACVRVLLGEDPVEPDDELKPCSNGGHKAIRNVIAVLSEFWESLRPPSVENQSVEKMEVETVVSEADDTIKAIKKLSTDIQEQLQISVCQAEPAVAHAATQSAPSSRTGLLYEEIVSSKHYCPWDPNHIESPARLTTSLQKIRERGLVDRCIQLQPRRADVSEICSYHDMGLVETLSETPNWDEPKLESLSSKFDDVYINEHSYESALIAAGSTVDAVKAVLDGRCSNTMVLVRPPGHHAMKAAINGFCIFNNVVIAAKMALEQYQLKKILIVDWDVHHGQGTQRAFYDDPRVLYFSVHRYENGTFWPNLRESHWDYIGSGNGEGYNINVPLNKIGMGDADYLAIFHHILLPLATQFDPELVIVSAGYDAAVGCPEGRMEVSPLCYGHLTRMLMPLANGRLCVVLEGGYCLDSLAEGVAMTLRALLGDFCPILPKPLKKPIDTTMTDVLLNLAYQLKGKWSSMKALLAAVDGVLMKMGRPPYTPTEPIYNWTPVVQTVYLTKNKYPVRPPEVIEHFHRLVEKMMAECSLDMTKYKLAVGCLPNECDSTLTAALKTENQQNGCLFLNGKKLAKDLALVHGQGLLEPLMKQLLGSQGLKDINQDSLNDAVATFEICLNALETIKNRESQCALVSIGVTSILDPTVGLVKFAQSKLSIKRVLIIDFHDQCRGHNSRAFYENDSVLYISMHRNDTWASTDNGHPENIGRGSGAGFNVNLIWNGKTVNDSEDLFALHHIILPLAYSFDPNLIIISSKFSDAASVYMSPASFAYFVHQLQPLAEGKMLLLMKGDGNCDAFTQRAKACAMTLLSNKLPVNLRLSPSGLSSNAILSYMETVFYLRPYWPYLQCVMAPNPHRAPSMTSSAAAASSVAEYLELQQQLGNVSSIFVGIPSANCPHIHGHGVCATVPTVNEINMAAPCDICGNVGENWICLTCWKVHCSRYVNEHAVLHSTSSGHPIALSMADLSVWCYICESYIRNEVILPAKRVLHLAKFGVEMPS